DVPDSRLVAMFGQHIDTLPERLHQTFLQTFSERSPQRSPERYPKPSPIQEQEQEQERVSLLNVPETLPPKPSPSELRESFDRFWSRYPRQDQRESARMIWLEMAPSSTVAEQIMASLEAHRLTKAWQDAIASRDLTFVPLAKTWLR